MKKLKLRLEDLRIDTFATTPVEKAKGTVFGEQYTGPSDCQLCLATEGFSCEGTCDATVCGTCEATVCGTCDATCEASCDGQTCWTCRGWYTQGGFLQPCAICD